MRTWSRAAAAGLVLAGTALSAQERPESILPPGFGGPPAAATPTPRAIQPGAAATPGPATEVVQPLPEPSDTASETPSPTPTMSAAELAEYELPASARRSLAQVGAAGEGEGALGPAAFGEADGRYLERLMRRLSAPLPSRWLSILLRRALVARVDTPAGVNGADFAAERAWLLLRMGEADASRAVAQGVDTGNVTPKLAQVTMNAVLAAGDPAGLCPLAERGPTLTGERGWTLASAMCAGLSGRAAEAKAAIAGARKRRVASGIDLQLAQKVAGAGPGGGQAVTIEWDAVDALTVWRFGLALATGVAIPDRLYATVGPQVALWRATAPGVAAVDRLAPADAAAAQGVLSSAALVDLYSAVGDDDDAPGAASAAASDLRDAYADAAADDRLAAIASVWGSAAAVPYARLVLTARAAARQPPRANVKEADRLVAAMLTAGLDRHAVSWRGAVAGGSDGWAMIALADPDGGALAYRDIASYAGSGDAVAKQRLFFAGLAGLGRMAPGEVERAAAALDVRIGTENSWTRALSAAARAGEPGTVALLAATGMQAATWRGVPPAMLYRVVLALRQVGLEGEARMIAAEAIART